MGRYNNILAATAFEKVNRTMILNLGINCAIMASELLSIQKYFMNKNKLNEYGFFFNTYDYFIQDTGLTRKQISNAILKLEKCGIVSTHTTYEKGSKIKWYKVNTKKYDKFLSSIDGSICITTETKDSHIIYNKILSQKVGPASAVVFSDLLTSFYNYEIEGNLLNNIWFKASQHNLAARCGITPKTICNTYLPILKEHNLIDLQYSGFPRTTYISINFNTLEDILNVSISNNNKESIDIIKSVSSNSSKEEEIVNNIISKVKSLSDKTWDFSYTKVQNIKDRLEEGTTEEQLYNIVEYMYKYYTQASKEKYYDKYFTWENLLGTKSKVRDWLKKIDNDTKKSEEKLKIEKITQNIATELNNYTKGEVNHTIRYEYVNLIKHRLEEGLTEEDLIQHAKRRYDFLKKGGYNINKGCSWNKLFGPKCFDEIHSVKSKKVFKINNNNSKDGVKSKTLTKEEINNSKQMADLYESRGEVGYF